MYGISVPHKTNECNGENKENEYKYQNIYNTKILSLSPYHDKFDTEMH